MNGDTTTRWTLTQLNLDGGRIVLRAKRKPSHRAAQGIVRGVIGGALLWGFVLLTAWAAWRAFFN